MLSYIKFFLSFLFLVLSACNNKSSNDNPNLQIVYNQKHNNNHNVDNQKHNNNQEEMLMDKNGTISKTENILDIKENKKISIDIVPPMDIDQALKLFQSDTINNSSLTPVESLNEFFNAFESNNLGADNFFNIFVKVYNKIKPLLLNIQSTPEAFKFLFENPRGNFLINSFRRSFKDYNMIKDIFLIKHLLSNLEVPLTEDEANRLGISPTDQITLKLINVIFEPSSLVFDLNLITRYFRELNKLYKSMLSELEREDSENKMSKVEKIKDFFMKNMESESVRALSCIEDKFSSHVNKLEETKKICTDLILNKKLRIKQELWQVYKSKKILPLVIDATNNNQINPINEIVPEKVNKNLNVPVDTTKIKFGFVPIDQEERKSTPVGIKNMVNTCFFNAMLQCLAASKIFKDEEYLPLDINYTFDKDILEANEEEEKVNLIKSYVSAIIYHLQNNIELKTENLRYIQKIIYFIDSTYKLGSQSDSRPFLFNLLNAIESIGGGEKIFKVEYGEINTIDVKYVENLEDKYIVSSNFTLKYSIEDNNFKYKLFNNTIVYLLKSAPLNLIMLKNNGNEFPEIAYFQSYDSYENLTDEDKPRLFNGEIALRKNDVYKYSLVAVCFYYGDGYSGHYIALRKYDDKWYNCNDNNVSHVNNEKVSQYLSGKVAFWKETYCIYEKITSEGFKE